MYTIRNINREYASGQAQVVLNISTSSPFSTDPKIQNETVIIPNGATMTDAELLAAVIAEHKLDPTTISFDAYIPPPAPKEETPAGS